MSERYGRASKGNTSWTSVLIGWLAALGASLIFSAVVSSVVEAIFGGGGSAQNMGTAGFVGLLTTLFLAFLIGGYTAGRMASRSGTKHGLLVALLALLVTLLLAALGGALGLAFLDNLQGVTLPNVPDVTQQGLNTVLTLGSILALLVPFISGAIGGSWGANTGRRRP